MHLELIRTAYLPEYTIGRLLTPEFELASISVPWVPHPDGPGGMIGDSCVPDGEYRLIPHDSERFPNTYAMVNEDLGVWYWPRPEGQEWGRTVCLIHVGNRVADVSGCIAVGMSFGRLAGEWAVLRSRDAMNKLRELLGRDEHRLTIRPTRGTEEP